MSQRINVKIVWVFLIVQLSLLFPIAKPGLLIGANNYVTVLLLILYGSIWAFFSLYLFNILHEETEGLCPDCPEEPSQCCSTCYKENCPSRCLNSYYCENCDFMDGCVSRNNDNPLFCETRFSENTAIV